MTNKRERPDTDTTPEYPLSAPIDPRDPERKKTNVDLEEEDLPESEVRVDDASPDDPEIAGNNGSGTPG